LAGVIVATTAFSPGGLVAAACSAHPARYDTPPITTSPLDHGWLVIQAIVSYPSVPSSSHGRNSPSLVPRPRQCCSTTANPASSSGTTGTMRNSASPYGLRINNVGTVPSGRCTLARRIVPSRIVTGTSSSVAIDRWGRFSIRMRAPDQVRV
jgi:hypothetical protein